MFYESVAFGPCVAREAISWTTRDINEMIKSHSGTEIFFKGGIQCLDAASKMQVPAISKFSFELAQ